MVEEGSRQNRGFCIILEGRERHGDDFKPINQPELFGTTVLNTEKYQEGLKKKLEEEDIEVTEFKISGISLVLFCRFTDEGEDDSVLTQLDKFLPQRFNTALQGLAEDLHVNPEYFIIHVSIENEFREEQRTDAGEQSPQNYELQGKAAPQPVDYSDMGQQGDDVDEGMCIIVEGREKCGDELKVLNSPMDFVKNFKEDNNCSIQLKKYLGSLDVEVKDIQCKDSVLHMFCDFQKEETTLEVFLSKYCSCELLERKFNKILQKLAPGLHITPSNFKIEIRIQGPPVKGKSSVEQLGDGHSKKNIQEKNEQKETSIQKDQEVSTLHNMQTFEIQMEVDCRQGKQNAKTLPLSDKAKFVNAIATGNFKDSCAEVMAEWDFTSTRLIIEGGKVMLMGIISQDTNILRFREDYKNSKVSESISKRLIKAGLNQKLGMASSNFVVDIIIDESCFHRYERQFKKTEEQRLPGALITGPPSENENTSWCGNAVESKHNETLFYLAVPKPKGTITKVWMESTEPDPKRITLKRPKGDEILWTTEKITVLNKSEFKYKYSYRCTHTDKQGSSKPNEEEISEKVYRSINNDHLQMDIFEHGPLDFNVFCCFFRQLLSQVDDSNLNLYLTMSFIKELGITYNTENMKAIIKKVICDSVTSKQLSKAQLCFCAVSLSQILPVPDKLDSTVIQPLLLGLGSCKPGLLSNWDDNKMGPFVQLVLSGTYGSKGLNWNHVLFHFIPALEAEKLLTFQEQYHLEVHQPFLTQATTKLCSQINYDGKPIILEELLPVWNSVEGLIDILGLCNDNASKTSIENKIGQLISKRIHETTELPELVELWASISKLDSILQTCVGEIIDKVSKIVYNRDATATVGWTESLQQVKVILIIHWEHDKYAVRRVLITMARSANPLLHSFCLEVLEDMPVVYPEENIRRIAIAWINTAIDTYVKRKLETGLHDILALYCYFDEILKNVTVKRCPGLVAQISNIVEGFCMKSHFKCFITVLPQSHNLSAETLNHFEENFNKKFDRVKERISDPITLEEYFLDMVDPETGHLQVQSRSANLMLTRLLDLSHLASCYAGNNLPGVYRLLLNFRKMWMAIKSAKGKYAENLQEHNAMKNATMFIQKLCDDMETMTIDRQIFKNLVGAIEHKPESFELLAAFHDKLTKDEVNRLKMTFQKTMDLLEEKETEKKNLEWFFGNFLKDFSEHVLITDLATTNELLGKIKELWYKKGPVNYFVPKDFWGKLKEFIKLSSELKKHHFLQSFSIYCKNEIKSGALQKSIGDMKYSGVDNADDTYNDECEQRTPSPSGVVEITCQQFAQFLGEKYAQDFRMVLQQMFDNEADIDICQTKIIFQNLHMIKEVMQEAHLWHVKIKPKKQSALESYLSHEDLREHVKALFIASQNIGVTSREHKTWAVLERFDKKELNDFQTTTLYAVHNEVEQVREILQRLNNEDQWDLITSLSKAKTLIEFLLEIPDENLLHLTDATEEHSEQHIKDGTVSDLILVHKVLYHLMQADRKNMSLEDFIAEIINISNSKTLDQKRNIPVRIDECTRNVYGLKLLYQNIANREELTKEIVQSALEIGKIKFEIEDSLKECVFTLRYETNGSHYTHNMQDLFDLRSRALLVANSERNDSVVEELGDTEKRKINMQLFVDIVELSSIIAETCTQLHQSGHFKYQQFHLDTSVGDTKVLEDVTTRLQEDLDEWNDCLADARKQYYPLNFVWGDQLMLLNETIEKGSIQESLEAQNVLRYIHPGILISPHLHKILRPGKEQGIKDQLINLGRKLDSVTEHLKQNVRFIKDPPCIENQDMKVKSGELYIALLDSGSLQVIPVIMMLYGDTVNCFPESNQLLFCHEDIYWEEIHLLLQRCFHLKRRTGLKELFCLANVHLLQGEMQTRLVEEVEKLLMKAKETKQSILLCFISESSQGSPVIDHFTKAIHRVNGLTDVAMEQLLQTYWPDTYMITSDVPGLGKSEFVKEKAAYDEMGTAIIKVTGPLRRNILVEDFASIKIQNGQVLHIDIGITPSSSLLNSFLFELIVVGAVSSGTKLAWLPADSIAIEVTNSIQHTLRDSLTFTHSFQRVHLEWEHYKNFKISEEKNSSTQVVCQYLEALDKGTIDDQNILLVGRMSVSLLPKLRCQTLLAKYFDQGEDMSFSVVMVFLDVLADQLKKMSASYFFRVENIRAMLGETTHQRLRYTLVSALINISKEFACRSVQSCRSSQALAEKNQYEAMVDRVKGMIQWADSNHLMIVFQSQGTQTVSALYRNKDVVPEDVKLLFKSQLQSDLEDYNTLDQTKFEKRLQRLVQIGVKGKSIMLNDLRNSYAITPDNFLKMVLINLRIKAGVPIILMGETGCGKTSLVKYLAAVWGIEIGIFNIHAGITKSQIQNRLSEADTEARHSPRLQHWLFLDEVNTSEHLGLLGEIICHHTYYGRNLTRNLKIVAACNPYRLRKSTQIMTNGLKGKLVKDPLSRLVYRVYPLPETMTDYVWDYGTLNEKDERAYIERMMSNVLLDFDKREILAPLLVESQNFLRSIEETAWCVSLRDVNRCRMLMPWFFDMLRAKQNFPTQENKENLPIDEAIYKTAILLALAHCYYSRIHKKEARDEYLGILAKILYPNNFKDANDLLKCITEEQMDLLSRMEIEKGIARNTALRENVFVLFVSILNKIPIFVVGKPGCSKSLSMQLLRSNLRGPDSNDEYFKTLPQLHVVPYQGSESSTSEGVLKVFTKAEKYLNNNRGQKVLPVVLLDEIGLAEVSRFNPLKVLHSLLEPATGKVPDVAVVGISNWALDAAKMNRAVHLSRPDLNQEELYQTAKSIGEEYHKDLTDPQRDIFEKLYGSMAAAYFEYQKKQKEINFHGLRDYYALIKYISKQDKSMIENNANEIILRGLHRNFGGGMQMEDVLQLFMENPTRDFNDGMLDNDISTKELIKENLSDPEARYLMLLTDGDAATGVVESLLKEQSREYEIIIGSNFGEDKTEDYCYRILSRIILCMERGVIIMLKDLDAIYGSLYDMLNQNYTKSGNKLHCRVAIGAYSNPLCHVHEGFKCVVLMDRKNMDLVDPPFLNRFEKQRLQFSYIMTSEQKKMVTTLNIWANSFSTSKDLHFTEEQCFLGFHEDLIPSLVLSCKQDSSDEYNEDEKKCKQKLLMLATPDAVKRLNVSGLAKTEYDIESAAHEYFQMKSHQSLKHCIANLSKESPYEGDDKYKHRIVIYTHSSIHTDLKLLLGKDFPAMIEKFSSFKSEKQLTNQIKKFWSNSDVKYFLMQCKPSLDAEHILLAKYQIESYRSQHKDKEDEEKSVIFIMHMGKNEKDSKAAWQFNFLNSWNLVTVDSLEDIEHPLSDFHDKSVMEVLDSTILPLSDVVKQHLLWAFTCIKYLGSETKRSVEEIIALIKKIESSEALMGGIMGALKRIIENGDSYDWQVKVACDVEVLGNASSFTNALCHYINNIVKNHLAKLVYSLETLGIWDCFLAAKGHNDANTLSVLEEYIPLEIFSDVSHVPNPAGSECYIVELKSFTTRFPFVTYFENQFERVKYRFHRNVRELEENYENLDASEMLHRECLRSQISKYKDDFVNIFGQFSRNSYFRDNLDLYIEDMIKCAIPSMQTYLQGEGLIETVKWILEDKVALFGVQDPLEKLVLAHIGLWYLEPLVFKVIQLVKSCTGSIPNGVNKLNCMVRDRLESIKRSILEEKAKAIDVLPLHDNSFQVVRDDEEVTDALSTQAEEEHQDARGLNKLHADGPNDSSSTDSVHGETPKKEYIPYIPNIMNSEKTTTTSYPTEAILDPQSSIEEEKISNIDPNTQENIDKADALKSEEIIQEVLVDYLCKEMYPTTESIEHNGNMKIWHGKALALLACGRSLDCQNLCSQTFLSLCGDLAGMILIPYKLNQDLLITLGQIGIEEKDSIMHNPNLHEYIFELTRELVKFKVPVETCQQFLCITLSRFVQYDSCSGMIPSFLSKAVSGTLPDQNLSFFGQVLHNIIWCYEDDEMFDVFCGILRGESLADKWGPLKYIEEELKRVQPIHVCSSFVILLIDLIEELALKVISDMILCDTSDEDRTWNLLAKACETALHEDKLSLRRITAVAFIKKAFRTLASQVEGQDDATRILKKTNVTLCCDSNDNVSATRTATLVGYFLNGMQKDIPYGKLMGKVEILSREMPVLQELEWPKNETILGLGYNPLATNPHYDVITGAWVLYCTDKKESGFKSFVQKCKASPNHYLGFLGFVMNSYTLIKPVRPIKDTEKQQMNYITENTAKFCFSWQLTVEKLLGRSDFNCEMLQLSQQSSLTKQQQASVLYHLMAVVVAHNPMNTDRKLPKSAPVLARCMLTPETISETILPAGGEYNVYSFYEQEKIHTSMTPILFTCKCGFVHLSTEKKVGCSLCHKWTIQDHFLVQENEGLSMLKITESKSSNCYNFVRTMSPLSYRVLHLLMQGSLLLSHALDFWPNVKDQEQKNQDLLVTSALQQFGTDWKILCEMLNETSDGVCKYIHMIIHQMTKLIAEVKNPCSSPELRQIYEDNISQFIDGQKDSRVKSANDWYVSTCLATGYKQDGIESILGEIPRKKDADITTSLFRMTGSKSFESLKLQFMMEKKQMATPLLGYVLQSRDLLELLVHLAPLLQWHREIFRHLNKQISHYEANEYTIERFLRNSEKKREDLYSRFSTAWDIIKKTENLMALGVDDKFADELPYMNRCLPLKTCFITDGNSPLMIMIKALMRVQNTTILQALRIALRAGDSSAAVGFYRSTNECTAAPCVYLQDASEKELMDFEWNEENLAFSQFNTGLGMGREVMYDFKKIERVVASSLFHGKAFLLLDENFPWFNLSGQLFHSHSNILQDLSSKISQTSISQQIKGDLTHKAENPEYARRLLTQFEIIIPYVNRQPEDANRSLIQYIETHFDGTFTTTSKELLPGHSDKILLSHIVDLYENTEALLVKTAVDSLDEKYRAHLPGDSKFSKEVPQLETCLLEDTLTAVGRIVKRYITTHQNLLTPGTPDLLKPDSRMLFLMEKPSIWPDSSTYQNIQPLFEDLHVCHIHQIYSSLLKSKEEKQLPTMIRSPSNRIAANFSSSLPGQRKSRKLNLS